MQRRWLVLLSLSPLHQRRSQCQPCSQSVTRQSKEGKERQRRLRDGCPIKRRKGGEEKLKEVRAKKKKGRQIRICFFAYDAEGAGRKIPMPDAKLRISILASLFFFVFATRKRKEGGEEERESAIFKANMREAMVREGGGEIKIHTSNIELFNISGNNILKGGTKDQLRRQR